LTKEKEEKLHDFCALLLCENHEYFMIPSVEKVKIVFLLFLIFFQCFLCTSSRCLKITEKVSFSISSEASYVYILNGQKLIKDAKNCPFWRVFENLQLAVKQRYQTDHFY